MAGKTRLGAGQPNRLTSSGRACINFSECGVLNKVTIDQLQGDGRQLEP